MPFMGSFFKLGVGELENRVVSWPNGPTKGECGRGIEELDTDDESD